MYMNACFNSTVFKPLHSILPFLQVHSIIKSGIENPGNENDLKRMQMMQLAELNGTFRPLDVLKLVS